jgi:hypothetical protein
VEDAVVYARELQSLGCAYVTVSGGGVVLDAKVPVSPGYQLPYAETGAPRGGDRHRRVGLIAGARQAEEIVASGKADFVALARGMLFDPRWPWHAALELGADVKYAPQYATRPTRRRGRGGKTGRLSDSWIPAYAGMTKALRCAGFELVGATAAVDRLQRHRPPPHAVDVLEHARCALEIESAPSAA